MRKLFFNFNFLFLLHLLPLFSKGEDWLIIANGPFLPLEKLTQLMAGKKVLALDGAANKLKEMHIRPDVILGDFDSIENLDYWGIKGTFDQIGLDTQPYVGKHDILIVPSKDQDFTDLQKGIIFCDLCEAKSIAIVNVVGGRMDHTLGNIGVLRRFYQKNRPMRIVTEREWIEYVKDGETKIYGKVGEHCAIMGYPEGRISTTGLAYDSKDYHLNLGIQESSCNLLSHPEATVKVQGEALVIHPNH